MNWIYSLCHNVFHWLVATSQDRLPNTTVSSTLHSNAYLIPYLYLCYLSRRCDTHRIRLALLPIIVFGALKGSFTFGGRYDHKPQFDEMTRGVTALLTILMSVDLALSKEGRLKVGEFNLPARGEGSNGRKDHRPSHLQRIFPFWFLDVIDVVFSLRGLGWKFGQDVHLPKEHRPLDRRSDFLKATTLTILTNWCVEDFLVSALAILPGLGAPSGGSIYYEQLPPTLRCLLTFTIAIATGVVFNYHLTMLYSIVTLFAVGLLGHSPTSWPPLFDNPWISTSLHEFWGMRWHQLFRRPFLVVGGVPGQWIAGRTGLVAGTFLASGLFHELPMYPVNRTVDHRTVFFFSVQAIGFALERLFMKITGRRVGGPLGWLWAFFFLIGTGHLFVDSLLSRGFVAAFANTLPKALSPWRRFIFPLLQKQIDEIVHLT